MKGSIVEAKPNRATLYVKTRGGEWKKVGEIDTASLVFPPECPPEPTPPTNRSLAPHRLHDFAFQITKIHPLALPPADCDTELN